MEVALQGFLISFVGTFACIMLFRYEERKGVRFLPTLRKGIDGSVVKTAEAIRHLSQRFGFAVVRQTFHYFFHTLLKVVSRNLKRFDVWLQKVIRAHKTLALEQNKENENTSKLAELALHKAAHTLTDEEKRVERERSLNAG